MTETIIVGPNSIHEWFSQSRQDWNTQSPVETVDAMWSGLENGSLSDQSSIVIFDGDLFTGEATSDEFSVAVATFSAAALVMIIAYEHTDKVALYRSVQNAAQQYSVDFGSLFFLDSWDDPFGDIQKAVASYQHGNASTEPENISEEIVDLPDEEAEPVYTEEPKRGTEKLTRKGIVIASTSSKGGSGKTTVALCTASMLYHSSRLAFEQGLAERPLDVVVVDMDTKDGQIGFLLGQQTPTSLNIKLSFDYSIENIKNNLIYHEKLGIHALLAPKRARAANLTDPEFYQEIIDVLASEFDVVVLDTSVNYTDELLGQVVLPTADAVMFVTNLSVGSVYGMTRWVDEVTTSQEDGGSGLPIGKIGVVVNQSMQGVGVDQEVLKDAAKGASLLVAIPLDTQAVVAASNYNGLDAIVLRHELISASYFALAKKLWKKTQLVGPLEEVTSKNSANAKKSGKEETAMPAARKSGLFGRRK